MTSSIDFQNGKPTDRTSMSAYYNEIEPFAAAWLRNLIRAGLIAPGDVDERSILDVRPDDLKRYVQCHFFAGIGIWSHALRNAGWLDDRPVWTGSCPCQPFSSAGLGNGFADERHLWPAWFHLIRECRPPSIFGEQVSTGGGYAWWDLVQADLEGENYSSRIQDRCATWDGAFCRRPRLFFVANADGKRQPGRQEQDRQTQRNREEAQRRDHTGGRGENVFARPKFVVSRCGRGRVLEPGIEPLVANATSSMGRLRAYGNAINARTAEAFIREAMSVLP